MNVKLRAWVVKDKAMIGHREVIERAHNQFNDSLSSDNPDIIMMSTFIRCRNIEVFEDDILLDEIECDEGDIHNLFIVTYIPERSAFALLSPMEREVYDEQGIEGIQENFDGFRYEVIEEDIQKMHYRGNIYSDRNILL